MTPISRSLALALLIGAGAAHGATDSLGIDSGIGLLTFGDLVVSGSRIEGGVAVGGNATIGSYSIEPGGDGFGVVVGGNLSFSSGSIGGDTTVGGRLTSSYRGSFGGNERVGGDLNATAGLSVGRDAQTIVWGSAIGLKPQSPTVTKGSGEFALGYDFDAARDQLGRLSTQLDAAADTGVAQLQWSTLHFDATGSSTAIFDIDAADAAKNMQIDGLAAGATVIINIHGSSVDFGNHGYLSFGSGQVLFNLPDATSVVFNGGTTASLLAPGATVRSGSGTINGQVIVDSWQSGVEINDVPFRGVLPATTAPSIAAVVPEPHNWALLFGGLFAVGVVVQRRQGRESARR